jgi:Cys-tRNA(Pro)/Cys-tRNA(Cys) deacylase
VAQLYDEIYLNGGQRGLQIRIKPDDLVMALECVVADLTR